MPQTQEFSGKDIDTAIKNACKKLTLSKNELKYDVISEGTSGIFGIVGRKDAKIRVTLPDIETQAEEELEGIRSIVDEAFGEETRLEDTRKPEVNPEKKVKPFEEPEAVDVSKEAIALGIEALQKMADLITDDAKITAGTEADSGASQGVGAISGRRGARVLRAQRIPATIPLLRQHRRDSQDQAHRG
ncbi:MAG: hypothetical protein HOC74_34980 [Gemmatimonadetes bacterium]|nr:hypothetical protein [Gemmatimonadota bacterium]